MTHASTAKSQRTQQIVYDALVKAALAGETCPSNSDLCTLVGSKTVSTPAHAISRMAKAGRLRVTYCNNGREIHIVEHDVTIISRTRLTMIKRGTLVPGAHRDAVPAEQLPAIADVRARRLARPPRAEHERFKRAQPKVAELKHAIAMQHVEF